jgi:predicted metalloprotease
MAVGGGIGGLVLLLVISAITGQNPADLLNTLGPASSSVSPDTGSVPADDPAYQFLSFVLGDTEQTWGQLFNESGESYEPPVLVLFTGSTPSACGLGDAAMGPFYCPADRKVYLDVSFFRDLDERFGAPGDFAQAYVVAHEVGHHIQTLTGVSAQVQAARQRVGEREGNTLSVLQELQADCYAGVWGHYAARRDVLDPGDVEEGLAAAASIGDDRLQQQSQGRVVPESFTHGSSAQRVEWFRRGLESGRVDACDTFERGATAN